MISEDGTGLALKAARLLEAKKLDLRLPELRISTQEEFLREAAKQPGLSIDERRLLLTQTEMVLRGLYAHLAFKNTEDPERDPFLALAKTRDLLASLSDFDFHTCLLLALARVKDVHTSYSAPPPYRGAVAFLPFQVRFFEKPAGVIHFVVTRTMATSEAGVFEHPHFGPGAKVVAWNGMEPVEAAATAAQLQPGANADADLSRGTVRLTSRSFGSHGVTADSVTIRYRAVDEETEREIKFPWQVAAGLGASSLPSTAFSVSESMMAMQNWSKYSYRPDKVITTAATANTGFFEAQFPSDPSRKGFPSPELLRNETDPDWPLGYLRIRNFAGDESLLEDRKLAEVADVLRRFDREAPGGLIIDIRGNPGGQIRLAERMLQLFSRQPVKPLLFHFPRTEMVQKALELFRTTGKPANEFKDWLEAQAGDEIEDAHLTPGRTITAPDLANDTGQVYQGPVVLLFDALTYSAADMFAAGFQDHNLGELIGVDCSTGGGGANAWRYDDILDNLPDELSRELAKLPQGCDLTVAVRRCTRTGGAKEAIEDIGVRPDHFHARTKRDLLEGNPDLFDFACYRLMKMPVSRIDVTRVEPTASGSDVTIMPMGVSYAVFRTETAVLAQGPVTEYTPRTFSIPLDSSGTPLQIRIEGYDSEAEAAKGSTPLAVPRVTLGMPEEEQEKPDRSFLKKPPTTRAAAGARAKAAGA